VNADRSSGGSLRGVESGADRMLRVQSTFHVADEAQGQDVAAKLIDRAHELANSPECECDVDVSVEWIHPEDLADPAGATTAGMAPAHEHPAAR
jgi:hypothetical protein